MSEGPELHALTAALGRLRTHTQVPAIDPAREQALLAAFDARQDLRRRPGSGRAVWLGVAAGLLAATAAVEWMVFSDRRTQADATADAPSYAADTAAFVEWPGTAGWPPLESGRLVRVELPLSALPALGLTAPSSSLTHVEADIVFGQDGLARAVRLVQQP